MSLIIFFCGLAVLLALLYCKAFKFEINRSGLKKVRKIKPPYAVVSVKNDEECVEGVIRSLAWQIKSQPDNGLSFISELVVIDLESEDETPIILKKLSEEYDFLHIMNKSEYMESIIDL